MKNKFLFAYLTLLQLVTFPSIGFSYIEQYRRYCADAVHNEGAFYAFKSHPIGAEVFGGVTYGAGAEFAKFITYKYPHLLGYLENFRSNDMLGSPILYHYEYMGHFSPGTLRFIKIAGDIQKLFGKLKKARILEIGGAYGGQCKILSELIDFDEYIFVELPEPLSLAEKYLDYLDVKKITYLTPEELLNAAPQEYDLVISNFSFSEFNMDDQKFYLEKIFRSCRHGYLLCNQPNKFPGIYAPQDLLIALRRYHTEVRLLPEEPRTYYNNYLAIWYKDKPGFYDKLNIK